MSTLTNTSAAVAVSGVEGETRFRKETEQPVQLLPESQITEGPLGFASAFSKSDSCVAPNPIAAAEFLQ